MGTPLFQQISLIDNGVLDNIEETPGSFILTNPLGGDNCRVAFML